MAAWQWAYRLVEVRNGQPCTLFHGVSLNLYGLVAIRSRTLPVGAWIPAVRKLVRDGTSKTEYLSGFNVLLSLEAMRQYRKRFTAPRDLRIARVKVNLQLRPKQHSRAAVWLADWMMVPKNWEVK